MTYVFIALGVICLLYCAGILISGVYGSWFFLIWGITGTAFLALAWLYQKNIWLRLPGIIQKLIIAAILTGAFLFLFIEAMIISKFTSKGIPDLDYLIVLGAQMRERPKQSPCLTLGHRSRLPDRKSRHTRSSLRRKRQQRTNKRGPGNVRIPAYKRHLPRPHPPGRPLHQHQREPAILPPTNPKGCLRRNRNQQLSRIPQHPPGRPTRLPPGLRPLSPLRHSHASQQHVPGILRSSKRSPIRKHDPALTQYPFYVNSIYIPRTLPFPTVRCSVSSLLRRARPVLYPLHGPSKNAGP